jgi:hypothetical protein
VPWFVIYSAGFFYIAGLNLEQSGLITRIRPRVTTPVKAD